MLEKFVAFQLFMMTPRKDEKGATATEYGLLVGLIALIIVIGVGLFGKSLNTFFSGLSTTVGGWTTN
ncbi:Flp family type IVb pilin [Nocardioides sp. P5_E3]